MLVSTSITTPLGMFRILANDQGLTAIILPGTGSSIVEEMPAYMRAPHPCLEQAARQVFEYCEGKRTAFDLCLSLKGTPFQLQVWDIIHRIPYGRTMSYGEIARQLGSTNKARAVGGAAHANPLPLVIPCHRVIGSNGSLIGFAGGVGLKKRLLCLEKNPF